MTPAPLHSMTPLVESDALSAASGFRVFVKQDTLQPTKSYKIRGLGNLCVRAAERGATTFVCASGGNAGVAAAYAGRQLKVPTVVYLPTTTPEFMRKRIEALGAVVRVHGNVFNEADEAARAFVAEDATARIYVPAFDHPDIWEGNASVITECFAQHQGGDFDAIVCAVGGGGLFNGIARGLEALGKSHIPIVAVETRGANCFNEAIKAGHPVRLSAITSIAKSLGALQISDESFRISQTRRVVSIVVSDREAVDACARFLDDQLLLVEPACGAALAAIYAPDKLRELNLAPGSKVLVVACGGQAVTLELLNRWLAEVPKEL